MAEIRKIYVERVKNLGNYETVRVGVEAILEKGDEPIETYKTLRTYVADLAEMDEQSIRLARQEVEIRSGKTKVG